MAKKNEKKQNKSKLNLQDLSQIQKIILALAIIILILGSLVFGNYFFRDNILSVGKDKNTENADGQVLGALKNLESKIGSTNPENLLVEEINLIDLDIYPESWVNRNFSSLESQNQLISGISADPDNDGLTNKEEYFYASNPKNAYTLCGQKLDKDGCDKNDKENVDQKISPLTGLSIEGSDLIEIKRLDKAIAEDLEESFSNASSDGVDFPEVYQLSKQIDLTEEYNQVEITTTEVNRNTIIGYLDNRAQILKKFAEFESLSVLTEIYKAVDIKSINSLKNQYQGMLDSFESISAPENNAELHRATIYSLRKGISLLDYRAEVTTNGTIERPEVREENKKRAVEMIWAFRKLTLENEKIKQIQVDELE